MQTALASKTEPENKSRPASDALASTPRQSPVESDVGAGAGIPLFLQRSALPASGSAPSQSPSASNSPLSGLLVNEPDDVFEREADRVAEHAARQTPAARAPASVSSGTPAIQRKCAACASSDHPCPACASRQELDEKLLPSPLRVQAKPLSSGITSASPLVGASGSGTPLAASVRERVEPALGVSLAHVQVHAGPEAQAMAGALQARAFTHQNHIWVGAQQSPEDVELMAHEAAHVVQQTQGAASGSRLQRKTVETTGAGDGESVRRRMQQIIDEAQGRKPSESGDSGAQPEIPPPSPTGAAPAAVNSATPGRAGKLDPKARLAARSVDKSELAETKNGILPQARPDVDRPAEQRPQVEASAQATTTQMEQPPAPLADAPATPSALPNASGADGTAQTAVPPGAKAGAKAEKGKPDAQGAGEHAQKGAGQAAQQAANLAAQAFASADIALPPIPPTSVTPPAPVNPMDAGGKPLPGDPTQDARIGDLASQAQALREQGQLLRAHATEGMANANILRGNLSLVRQGIGGAVQGVGTAKGHLGFRRGLLSQAQQALAASEKTAARVGEQAPEGVAKSDEGKQQSGPMAGEARDMSAQNSAQAPDDDEAAQNSQEQGSKLNQVGSDSGTIDNTLTQAQGAAGTLVQDAAHATQVNTQTRGRVDTIGETLTQTEGRLGEMQAQNAQAQAETDALHEQPAHITAQSQTLDSEGEALINASQEMEARLHETQARYAEGMQGVPALPAAPPAGEASASDVVIQRAPDPAAPSAAAPEAAPAQAPVADAAPQPFNLTEGVPDWLTGEETPTEAQRRTQQQAEEQRRQDEITAIETEAGGHFERLSAADKRRIAIRMMGHNLFGGVGRISWPSWGGVGRGALHLAAGLIDPRAPMMGVVSGLNMIINGGLNFFRKPSWGGALKAAADIATGLTIILGSITALAGVIAAIMTAITLLSLGTAAPITGPIIAFCATVMSTVGGWTLTVGSVALLLQELVFLKNLYEAGTAQTADALQQQSDHMTEDARNAGNVVMQMGMAKLAQVGGRGLQTEIAEAGGGVRFAAQMGARGLPARVVTGVQEAGGVGAYARGAAGSLTRGAGRRIGVVRSSIAGAVSRVGASVERGGVTGLARDVGTGAWRGVRGAAGRAWKGLNAESPAMTGRQGLSRDFLVGKNVPEGELAAVASDARAAARRGLVNDMRAGGELPPVREPAAVPPADTVPSAPVTEPAAAAPHETPATRVTDGSAELGSAPAETGAAREASVRESGHIESDQLSARELRNEEAYLAEHPDQVEGVAPDRHARVGDHEWREEPGQGWCRRSGDKVCDLEFGRARAEMQTNAPAPNNPAALPGEDTIAHQSRLATRRLNESDAAYEMRMSETIDHLPDGEVKQGLQNRLARQRERRYSSEESLNATGTGDSPLRQAGERPYEYQTRLRVAKDEIPTPTTEEELGRMAARENDLDARLRRLDEYDRRKAMPEPQTGGPKSDPQWDAPGTAREPGRIAAAQARRQGLSGSADEVERQILSDAITGSASSERLADIWAASPEEAQRIFHTMEEMVERGELQAGDRALQAADSPAFRRDPSDGQIGPGGRIEKPFRGPERHMAGSEGPSATHYNADFYFQGRKVTLHIFFPGSPAP